MKTSELMIGDLLYLNRRPVRVDAIGFNGSISYSEKGGFGGIGVDKLSPIPLTEEILAKNGFELCCDVEQQPFYRYKEDWCIGLWISSDGFDYDLTIEVHYVHQLQHLLRLCGIDKEIEL